MVKTCTKCLQTKNINQFNVRKTSKDGLNYWCKNCHSVNTIKAISKNKEHYDKKKLERPRLKPRQRSDYEVKHKFGLTSQDYENLLKSQNNCCAICKSHKDTFSKRLSVDHCHNTLKIRGLLCQSCNMALGLLKDSISNLDSAINYIKSATK
jgi:hypothetical protein